MITILLLKDCNSGDERRWTMDKLELLKALASPVANSLLQQPEGAYAPLSQ
jgi:hypothetical protein